MTQSELKVVLDCLEAIERRRIIDELQKEAKFQVDGFQGKASNAPNDRVAMSLMRRQHAYSLFQSKVKLLCPELDDIYRDGYSREKALDILSRNNAAAVGLSILVQEGHLDDNVLQRLKATNIPATIEEQANACCPGKCEILKTEKDANKQLGKRLREAKELAQDREKNIAELKAALREKEEYVRMKEDEISKLHALLTETTEAHRKICEERQNIEEKYIAQMHESHEAYDKLHQEFLAVCEKNEMLKKQIQGFAREIVVFAHNRMKLTRQITANVRFIDPELPYDEIDHSKIDDLIMVESELSVIQQRLLYKQFGKHIHSVATPLKLQEYLVNKEDT